MFEAEQKFKRAAELFKQGVASKEATDEAEARSQSYKALYDAALQSVQNLKAQAKQNRAAVELAKKKLQDTDIRAPFDGFVKERFVSPATKFAGAVARTRSYSSRANGIISVTARPSWCSVTEIGSNGLRLCSRRSGAVWCRGIR